MDMQYLLSTFVLWCLNAFLSVECDSQFIKNRHISRYHSIDTQPYSRLLKYIKQSGSKTLLHKRFFEFNPYYFQHSASSDSGKRVMHHSPLYAYRGMQERVKTKPVTIENGKVTNEVSLINHFAGIRTVLMLYLQLVQLTENGNTNAYHRSSANLDATHSAQSFGTILEDEQESVPFVTTRAFENQESGVNIDLELESLFGASRAPDETTSNNDVNSFSQNSQVVAHDVNNMHHFDKHLHGNIITKTETETISLASDVPITQTNFETFVANNTHNNSLVVQNSIHNNKSVLQIGTENEIVSDSVQVTNISGGVHSNQQHILPDTFDHGTLGTDNRTLGSVYDDELSFIHDTYKDYHIPDLKQKIYADDNNADVLPDGFLSYDELNSLYGSYGSPDMYENYDLSGPNLGFGRINGAPVASGFEEKTEMSSSKPNDGFIHANNNGGFASFRSFNSAQDNCEDIDTRACFDNSDCSCYGLYVCVQSYCQLIGRTQETDTISGGYWHDGPADIPVYN